MPPTATLGPGTHPDIAYDVEWAIAWQAQTWLRWAWWHPDSGVVAEDDRPIGPDAGAFVRLWLDGDLWTAYRVGAPDYAVCVLREGLLEHRSGYPGWGTDPVCGGPDAVYAQSDRTVWRYTLSSGQSTVVDGLAPRPTGLSHVSPAGQLVTVDAARLAEPGMTRPCYAGALIVGEHPEGGVVCRLPGRSDLVLWPGETTYTPRCAWDGGGRYGVVTWGPAGVRVAELTEADWPTAPEDRWVPLREGAALPDLLPILLGDDGAWPRTTADGGRFDRVVEGDDTHGRVYWLKPREDRRQWEVWDWDGERLWLRRDHDDPEAGRIYEWSPETTWLLRHMTVGLTLNYPQNRIRWRQGASWGDWQGFPLTMRLERAWRHPDGRYRIQWTYDPGTPETYVAESGLGWWSWQRKTQHVTWPVPVSAPPRRPVGLLPPPDYGPAEAPLVTIDAYDALLRLGQPWTVRLHDRAGRDGLQVEVRLDPTSPQTWRLSATVRNGAGQDTSARPRIVRWGG